MKQTTKRVVAFFAAMGLMVSGLSLNEPASADAKAKAKVKSVTIKNVKKKLTLKKGDYLHIPKNCKHRLDSTSIDPVCVWLCVFDIE